MNLKNNYLVYSLKNLLDKNGKSLWFGLLNLAKLNNLWKSLVIYSSHDSSIFFLDEKTNLRYPNLENCDDTLKMYACGSPIPFFPFLTNGNVLNLSMQKSYTNFLNASVSLLNLLIYQLYGIKEELCI